MIRIPAYLLLFTALLSSCTGEEFTGIRPFEENPAYWQYNGRPVFLFGGSDRDNIFQWAGDGSRLEDHLDLLKSCGGNYIRCTMSSREYTREGYRWDLLPYPFTKKEGLYDLDRWNQVYWDKLETFLVETSERGIMVQLELWDRWNEFGQSGVKNPANGYGWFYSPFNPDNNINYDWGDSPLLKEGRTAFYNEFHYAAVRGDSLLLHYQHAFVRKIMDVVMDNGFDHVIFQVDNESGIGAEDLEPDPYWAGFIREYGLNKNPKHPVYVCTSRRFHFPSPHLTRDFQDPENPEIRVPIGNPAFNFCDISQNNGNSGQQHYDNFLWYRELVHGTGIRPINNVKCYHFNWCTGCDFHEGRYSPSDEEAIAKFWRNVFAGAASVRFHRETPYRAGGLRDGFGLTPEGQHYITGMNMFLDSVRIFSMVPDNSLLSHRQSNEAYCLAEAGIQYAVFFTGEGDRTVTLHTGSTGPGSVCWLDLAGNGWTQSSSIDISPHLQLEVPGDGALWVALIKTGF